ncbi:MAG TPA: CheR family methyltransferase, partial [bacterium]|nr:CheR family methyltransferase [bacterium]
MADSAPPPEPLKQELPFPVVGIGASAGGLEACQQFLQGLTSTTGMAFVLIQHLSPTHESMLPQILSKHSPIPVHQARNGIKLKPNCLFVTPPNATMTIDRGRLFLHPKTAAAQKEMPIDAFLRSLAEAQGSRSIAVILSGTGTDGALGTVDIKRNGGVVFAQDASAKYDGMPRAAQATDCVDFVLAPGAIAIQLASMASHPYVRQVPVTRDSLPKNWDEASLARLLKLLREATGVDFTYYKQTTLHRRILRRMALSKVDRLESYLRELNKSPDEMDALYQDILIKVTHFFRDKPTFDFLQKRILPELVKNRPRDLPLRIWVPGCSTGEEVYSLAICLLEFFQTIKLENSFQIFATDISNSALEKARAGYYIENIAFDVSPERLRRYFIRVEKGFQIAKSIRELCVFARHNVVQDPPFSRMDLISCRNLLIYLEPILQRKVIPIFHYALKLNGYLSLGTSESIGGFSDLFSPVDKRHRFY